MAGKKGGQACRPKSDPPFPSSQKWSTQKAQVPGFGSAVGQRVGDHSYTARWTRPCILVLVLFLIFLGAIAVPSATRVCCWLWSLFSFSAKRTCPWRDALFSSASRHGGCLVFDEFSYALLGAKRSRERGVVHKHRDSTSFRYANLQFFQFMKSSLAG